jgi:hypothetical protein
LRFASEFDNAPRMGKFRREGGHSPKGHKVDDGKSAVNHLPLVARRVVLPTLVLGQWPSW